MRCQNDPSHFLDADARSDARFCSDRCRASWNRRERNRRIDAAIALAEAREALDIVDTLRGL
ncbi:hypothetical protein ASE25_19360 [Terrabacter sp. Root85]|uniref:hypothetical protein n=1 Tax=Terrabacter sp. Root85 TaxID=1736603 RepID=UPI0006FEBCCA|nr:hypothetical protein [Terrabacter sp. Root85]KRC85210.1 hypothetical protein ASE25_19360 [Terrabacter sp. Root85]